MNPNYRLVLQAIGSLENSSIQHIVEATNLSPWICHYTIAGCKSHKWINNVAGQWELTDRGLEAYNNG